MPRVSDLYLRSVVYLYPSAVAAREGHPAGGTGFLIGMDSEAHPKQDWLHLYAVTNHHVIDDAKSPVIRLNAKRGGTYIQELTADDWLYPDSGDDLAATYLGWFEKGKFKYSCALLEACISRDTMIEHDIGPGDDVFVAGRFLAIGGVERNEPCVRSGIFSMWPSEPIFDSYNHPQESLLVEVRALRGSSGSPVWVRIRSSDGRQTRDAQAEFDRMKNDPTMSEDERRFAEFRALGGDGQWLLGIAFADIYFDEPVVFRTEKHGVTSDTPSKYVARSNSGQMAVIPAWRIRDFIEHDERFIMARKTKDEQVERGKRESPLRPIAQKTDEQRPLTREDFTKTLKRVSRKTS